MPTNIVYEPHLGYCVLCKYIVAIVTTLVVAICPSTPFKAERSQAERTGRFDGRTFGDNVREGWRE